MTGLTLSAIWSADDFYLRRPSMVTSSGSSFVAAARTIAWNDVQNLTTMSSGTVLSKVARVIESGPLGVEHTCEGPHNY